MRPFAEKPKAVPQGGAGKSTTLSGRLQTANNQGMNAAVREPGRLEKPTGKYEAVGPGQSERGNGISSGGHFAHDFSRTPIYSRPDMKSHGRSSGVTSGKQGADGGGGGGGGSAAPAPATGSAGKTIDIYAVSLPGSTRDPFADVARASTIWSQCSLKVNVSGGESWNTDVLDQLSPTGVLNEYSSPSSPTQEEIDLLNHHPGGKSTIHAYFVPSLSAGSRGESFWASVTPNGVRAVVVSNSAAVDTFAHELGHVLLNDGGHHSDPDNLMATGSIRNVGVDKLDSTQCSKV